MNKFQFSLLAACAVINTAAYAADFKATEGQWTLEISESTGKLRISNGGTAVFNDTYAEATFNYLNDNTVHTISSRENTTMPEVTVNSVSDCFGEGKTYNIIYTQDSVELIQELSFYPDLPYMIVQASVRNKSGKELQSNHLVALAIGASSTPLKGASNRMVWVPFDNDGHLKYEIFQLKNGEECTSHEVGYVFDGDSRIGLVAGSVDHDNWKSGVTIAGQYGYRLDKFECMSGLTDYFTRDLLPHGKLTGTSVSSARFFVGLYDDWREGLNDYGDANTKVVPKAPWEDGNPMGWSSWGVQQNYINYDGVVESAQFIKSLYDYGFHMNNGKTVISLDAFATDNIPAADLYKLGTKVFSDGTYRDGRDTKEGLNMTLGEYCGPLVAWEWALDSKVQGTGLNGTPDYTVRDIALKVNGKPYVVTSNNGCAVDPTHPGVKANIEFFMKQFATNGVKYIKVDFLNNGIIEGDSWYDPNITTGVQAYNYGMKLLYDEAVKYGMYIVESISPIFPYQYAHGRRTCCDSFSEISETEYVMNAISYGWWTDRLYTVNDPDQLVFCKMGHGAKETEGENRARTISGMATGAFIFGDNYSDKVLFTDDNGHQKGTVVGYPEESRRRGMLFMTNEEINSYVSNNTGSFMPIDGHKPSTDRSAESRFMRRTDDAMYVAIFNYGKIFASSGSISFKRLGLKDDEVGSIKELWSGETVTPVNGAIEYNIPAKDVKVYKISLESQSGINEVVNDMTDNKVKVFNIGNKHYSIEAPETITSCEVYNLSGMHTYSAKSMGTSVIELDLSNLFEGVYVLNVKLADGSVNTVKLVNL